MPPQWMWSVDSELEAWFEAVESRREEKYGGGSSSSGDEEVGLMDNELVRGRK